MDAECISAFVLKAFVNRTNRRIDIRIVRFCRSTWQASIRMTSTNDMPAPFAKLGTRALVVLTLVNMFNYIDRYVVPPLFESLRNDPVMRHPSDAQLGGLMTAFLVVYMVTSPLFGTLGDRMSRMRLIAFGVALWSLATAIGGLVG